MTNEPMTNRTMDNDNVTIINDNDWMTDNDS